MFYGRVILHPLFLRESDFVALVLYKLAFIFSFLGMYKNMHPHFKNPNEDTTICNRLVKVLFFKKERFVKFIYH